MKISELARDKQRLVVEIEGATFAQLNTLRRYLMNEVPTIAIEDVEFTKNSSILYDEMVALRLGLLPLTTDLEGYAIPSEDEKKTGDYHAKSSVKATLSAKGPCVVYAKDLSFKDPKIKPVYPETPLVKLLDGQELELTATAVLGTGREHAKWSPCLAYYRQAPSIAFGKDADAKAIGQVLKELKLDAVTEKGGKLQADERKLLLVENPDVYEDIKELKVTYADDAFVFTIESWGQLAPVAIVESAVERCGEACKEFEKLVKAL